MSYNVKQVIVMRKDLNMRKGKMVAQGSHASLGAILSVGNVDLRIQDADDIVINVSDHHALKQWLSGGFAKICVSVDSEEQLLEIYNKAKEAGLINCLITDNGHTEFNGIPTLTCCAIGPASSEDVDKITGQLKLL